MVSIMSVTSFNELSYSIGFEGKEHVLPKELLELINDKSEHNQD